MVDVTTGLRQHPLETVHRFVFLVLGVVILGAPLSVIVIYQTVSALNALLEHSNIQFNKKLDRVLSLIFVTPNFHKVHHSVSAEHSNANFGNIFSLWDRLFGTHKHIETPANLRYGLDGENRSGIGRLLLAPFRRKAT
jgi:sterol desaturase/sphingolipid hydroxylase (fatty acid hydroxylase superfamily)